MAAAELLEKLEEAKAIHDKHSESFDKYHVEHFIAIIGEAEKIALKHTEELLRIAEDEGYDWEDTYFWSQDLR